jgi:hypothetical protein
MKEEKPKTVSYPRHLATVDRQVQKSFPIIRGTKSIVNIYVPQSRGMSGLGQFIR